MFCSFVFSSLRSNWDLEVDKICWNGLSVKNLVINFHHNITGGRFLLNFFPSRIPNSQQQKKRISWRKPQFPIFFLNQLSSDQNLYLLYIWGLYDPGIVRSQYKDSYKTNQYNKRMSWGFCCRRSIFVLRMSEVSTKNSFIRNFGHSSVCQIESISKIISNPNHPDGVW